MVKPKSFKQQSLGLSFVPASVSVAVTSGAQTQTMVATFKDYYGHTIKERALVGMFVTSAYASYVPFADFTAACTLTVENPVRPTAITASYSSNVTSGYLYEFVTCSDGTATIVVTYSAAASIYPKFTYGGRTLEDYTAAVSFT